MHTAIRIYDIPMLYPVASVVAASSGGGGGGAGGLGRSLAFPSVAAAAAATAAAAAQAAAAASVAAMSAAIVAGRPAQDDLFVLLRVLSRRWSRSLWCARLQRAIVCVCVL